MGMANQISNERIPYDLAMERTRKARAHIKELRGHLIYLVLPVAIRKALDRIEDDLSYIDGYLKDERDG